MPLLTLRASSFIDRKHADDNPYVKKIIIRLSRVFPKLFRDQQEYKLYRSSENYVGGRSRVFQTIFEYRTG
jgi:hypothetical protein